ncbi:hypothetical protein PV735_07975 [Streptomyces turgidiscabies]|uniref:Uncharacterized protein n=1 Tax=Streptomyces turgidiscabies (strain Car8) TaxID=698760 RepID=L7FJE3_STRT8|nr:MULTISPECIES: hypothetical protein [Streptomyces]ELP70825.1 hypothetical protein STRTUCAR8_05035 [Streptomyces turgidiscabies Car8]MDX3492628.1 hypothetical protein [Streptomyces turgidiscabies]GAQ69076.1 hypothetical protein T45_00798 [Streptomyces turgidiscabies]
MTTHTTDPVQHPRTAADAVRAFNHATLPTFGEGPQLAYPGTVYRALAAFTTLARGLPQAYDQIGTALARLHQTGHLTADHGTPTQHTDAVSIALREAEHHATAMTAALERAHSASAPLGYNGPIDDDTDDDL